MDANESNEFNATLNALPMLAKNILMPISLTCLIPRVMTFFCMLISITMQLDENIVLET